ncbi:MAG: hypothetical protein EOO77_16580 [Oxalobacteraceae bacterium]|nr:MAG: hypothetical protein EOO77_16580 [Oxalobacteraceae bacterium]
MGLLSSILKLPKLQARLPVVNGDGTPTSQFLDAINRAFANIEASDEKQTEVLNQIADLLQLSGDANDTIAIQARQIALVNSYTNPLQVITVVGNDDGTTASVTILNHRRVYADASGTSVLITGKTFNGLSLNTTYYFYYDDAARKGGAVDIKYSQNPLDAAQSGNRHSLGSILTPYGPQAVQKGGGIYPYGAGRYANQVQQ